MAAVMTIAAVADDAVAVRQLRARGLPETLLRQQLAAVATPRIPRFVFVRRLTLRGEPRQIGQAMAAALAQLADDARQDILSFADFPALAVACARAALHGGLDGWHWRTLGVPRLAAAGDAIAALLTAHPLEAASVVAALAEARLLSPVWRTLSEAAAGQLVSALAQATGFPVPAWPGPAAAVAADHPPVAPMPLVQRARALWAEALHPLPPRSEAVRAAAMLSLLRWSPAALRSIDDALWPTLLAEITAAPDQSAPAPPARPDRRDAEASTSPVAAQPPAREMARRSPPELAGVDEAIAPSPIAAEPATEEAPPHGEEIATGWGGVLFLINALRRLDIEAIIDFADPASPTGWRLLRELGLAFGIPEDEPLAAFLAAQDLDTVLPPAELAQLLGGIEALYRPQGPWPLPLAQPALLRASETHLDLDLAATNIEVALRLSGLDLDPGWVPWLGRVVAFHYDHLPTFVRPSG